MFLNFFTSPHHPLEWTLTPVLYPEDDPLNFSGKVKLPEIILEDLILESVEAPYTFEISHSNKMYHTHCGIHDFTAPFGEVHIPKWLFTQLDMFDIDKVQLSFKKINKGEYLKLLPHSVDFLELENPKYALEKCFNNYPVLSVGDEIMCNIIDFGPMRFTIGDVLNEEGVIYTVDTDLEVDFMEPIGYKKMIEESSNNFIKYKVDKESGYTLIESSGLGLVFDIEDK